MVNKGGEGEGVFCFGGYESEFFEIGGGYGDMVEGIRDEFWGCVVIFVDLGAVRYQ